MTWFRRQDPKEVARRVREKVERWEKERAAEREAERAAAEAAGKTARPVKPEDYGKLAEECHQVVDQAQAAEQVRADWAVREWQRIRLGEPTTLIDPDPAMTVDDVAAVPALADRLGVCGWDREWLAEMGIIW